MRAELKITRERLLEEYRSHMLPGPLNGIIVVGLCYYIAGPIALQTLVQQGALVIKVERLPIGDPSRHVFHPAFFTSLAHGQLSFGVDYAHHEDKKVLQVLLRTADIILDNRSFEAKNHDAILQFYLQQMYKPMPLIYCSIDGFPNAGTNNAPGLDASIQAATGFAYSNCAAPDRPLKVGVPILDMTTGLLAANYILANLFYLKNTDLPPETKNVIHIAVSLAGASMWLQSNQVANALYGIEYFRTGNQDALVAPFSYYTARDGLISIATVNEVQFQNFCLFVLENAPFHGQYSTIQQRMERQAVFEQELNELLVTHDKAYWIEKCRVHRVPAAAVVTVSEAVQEKWVKESVLRYSASGLPVVTYGAFHSIFSPRLQHTVMPEAPPLNQDHALLSSVCEPMYHAIVPQ